MLLMSLLAQADAANFSLIERWIDRFGIGGAVCVILIILLWTEGRAFIREQRELSKAARLHLYSDAEHKKTLAEALGRIAAATMFRSDPVGDARYSRHVFSTVYTNRAIARGLQGIEVGLEHLCADAATAAKPHFEAARNMLNDDIDDRKGDGDGVEKRQ